MDFMMQTRMTQAKLAPRRIQNGVAGGDRCHPFTLRRSTATEDGCPGGLGLMC